MARYDASGNDGYYPEKASIHFLPFINLPASDENCLYSTLSFIASQGTKYGFAPVLTFDQPLYWKSLQIVKSVNPSSSVSKIVLNLGGFHTMMSFLGAMGHLMDGSGKNSKLYTPISIW